MNIRARLGELERKLQRSDDNRFLDALVATMRDPRARAELDRLCASYRGKSRLPEVADAIFGDDDDEEGEIYA
jgi:hypothetical protein